MRAYDLYNQVKEEQRLSGNEEDAKKYGYVDELNNLYKELYEISYLKALKEDFTDEEFKNDFYKKYDGEINKPEIDHYALEVHFLPLFPNQVLQLIIDKIKRKQDIAPIDKTRIYVSSKYFEDYESLKDFVIELKMKYSDKYDVRIIDNASK